MQAPRHESHGALVVFTILMQTCVGGVMALVIGSGLLSEDAGVSSVPRLPVAVIALLTLVAICVSTLHLGRPLTAPLAAANLRSSWISREVVASALFFAALVVFLVLDAGGSTRGPMTALVAAGVFGGATVVAMTFIYAVPSQPQWSARAALAKFNLPLVTVGCPLVAVWFASGAGHQRVAVALLLVVIASATTETLRRRRFYRSARIGFWK